MNVSLAHPPPDQSTTTSFSSAGLPFTRPPSFHKGIVDMADASGRMSSSGSSGSSSSSPTHSSSHIEPSWSVPYQQSSHPSHPSYSMNRDLLCEQLQVREASFVNIPMSVCVDRGSTGMSLERPALNALNADQSTFAINNTMDRGVFNMDRGALNADKQSMMDRGAPIDRMASNSIMMDRNASSFVVDRGAPPLPESWEHQSSLLSSNNHNQTPLNFSMSSHPSSGYPQRFLPDSSPSANQQQVLQHLLRERSDGNNVNGNSLRHGGLERHAHQPAMMDELLNGGMGYMSHPQNGRDHQSWVWQNVAYRAS